MTDVLERPVLTERQRRILDFVVDFRDRRGYCCTIRELCAEFGIASPNGIAAHLHSLRRKGYVTWEPHQSRTIRPTEVPHADSEQ